MGCNEVCGKEKEKRKKNTNIKNCKNISKSQNQKIYL